MVLIQCLIKEDENTRGNALNALSKFTNELGEV